MIYKDSCSKQFICPPLKRKQQQKVRPLQNSSPDDEYFDQKRSIFVNRRFRGLEA